MDRQNPRCPEAEVNAQFIDRWSPRAFDPTPLTEEQIDSLFEAARWAPSCYNDQPAVFVYATTEDDRRRFATALVEGNRVWARSAPMLMFVLARRAFSHNGKANRWAGFDAGAAWMSLALQARHLGLYTHAMAGFDVAVAQNLLEVDPDEFDILAAVAIGRRAHPDNLPDAIQQNESPNERRPLKQVSCRGKAPQ